MQMLFDGVKLLSLNAEAQLQHLHQLGLDEFIDELALEFDDRTSAAALMFTEKEISLREFELVQALRGVLRSISGQSNSRLWTASALRESREWSQIRAMANEALNVLTSKNEGERGPSPGNATC
jgi:hypothetical protein